MATVPPLRFSAPLRSLRFLPASFAACRRSPSRDTPPVTPDLPTPTLSSPDALPPRHLSTDLRELLHAADGRALTLRELEEILQGRGFALVILLLTLPFLFVISIPGLSLIFGAVIGVMGLRIALGQTPSLPRFILRRELKYSTIERMVGVGLRLCGWLERFVRPRMHFLRRWPGMINLIGLGIASGGLQLVLPLPPLIPLSNFLPAVSVMFLTAGLMERDGLLVLAGYLVNIGGWIYFAFMFFAAGEGMQSLWHYFSR